MCPQGKGCRLEKYVLIDLPTDKSIGQLTLMTNDLLTSVDDTLEVRFEGAKTLTAKYVRLVAADGRTTLRVTETARIMTETTD